MALLPKRHTDKKLIKLLTDGTLSPLEFTHEAHIQLVWLIHQKGDGKVLEQVSNTIKHYANSIGEGNIFHETLTYAAVRLVQNRINRHHYSNFTEFIEDNNDLLVNFKELILGHYTEETLNTAKAKKEIVLPDKRPF